MMMDFSRVPYQPVLHGTYIDELIFGIGFVLSIALFIYLALADKKRENKSDEDQNVDDQSD